MTPTVTATYAAILAIFYVAMSFYVIRQRVLTDINIGDGGDPNMLLAMRRHANMAEYVPFALLVMGLAEFLGLGALWLNIAGSALVMGRMLHPLGMHVTEGSIVPRVIGTLATMAAILIPAGGILLTNIV